MFVTIFLVGIIFTQIFIFWHYSVHQKYGKLIQNFGALESWPFVGVFFSFLNYKEFLFKWPTMIQNSNSMSMFAMYGPCIPTFYTSNPIFIKKLLLSSNCNEKAAIYNLLLREIGAGLLMIGGTKWTHHRKLLNPSFNDKILRRFLMNFNQKSSCFLKVLDDIIEKDEVNLDSFCQAFAIKTSFATNMDFELEEDNEEHMRLVTHLSRFMRLTSISMGNVHHHLNLLYRFTENNKLATESKKIVCQFLEKIIDDKMTKTMADRKLESIEDSIDIRKSNKCFLLQAMKLHLDGKFSRDELFDEILTIILTGYETSATTLHSVLIMLAMHPEYQECLFEEIANYYPEKEFVVGYEDLKHLTYLERVINETIRVAPTVPSFGRICTKDIPLADDLVLPRGTTFIIDLYNMQRDESVWGPRAKFFNPDNFLPENLGSKGNSCFFPFSMGPRNCIGWRFALLSLKVSVAQIVRNYRLTTNFRYEDLHIVFGVSLRYKDEPHLKVFRR